MTALSANSVPNNFGCSARCCSCWSSCGGIQSGIEPAGGFNSEDKEVHDRDQLMLLYLQLLIGCMGKVS